MNPDELRTLIAEEIRNALKPFEAELKTELKEINAKVEDVKDTLTEKVEDVKDTLTAKVEDVRIEQARLNAMFKMHIAHTAERKADKETFEAQQKAETAERWKIAAILSAIGFSVISLLNQIFGWFGKHGN